MLKNTKPFIHTEAQLMINSLHESHFEFYLTGSHYFGNVHDRSDWDFFTDYSGEIESFLLSKGFKKDDSSGYNDALCKAVFTWKPTMPEDFFDVSFHSSIEDARGDFLRENLSDHIQVQLVSDAKVKQTVQFFLKRNVSQLVFGNKNTVSQIWNFGTDLVLAMSNQIPTGD